MVNPTRPHTQLLGDRSHGHRSLRYRFPVLCSILLVVLLACPRGARAAITLLPPGPVIGDGKTPTALRLLVDDLHPDHRFRIKADRGRVGEITATADGVVSFRYVPPVLTAPETLGLRVIRRGAGARDEKRLELEGVPAWAGRLEITFDPPRLPAGEASALVRITPSSATPQDAAARRFLLSCTAGTVTEATAAGDGTWVARYTAPEDLTDPRTVIIAAADAAAPTRILGWASLPLKVRRSVSIEVPPDASTVLTVGDASYGPLKASPAGSVAFDVDLDPGFPHGRVEAAPPTGETVDKVVDLPLPDYPRVGFIPLPPAIPADPTADPLPIRVVVNDLGGGPVREPLPEILSSRGQISAVSSTRIPGVFEAAFTPPDQPGEVVFTAAFEGSRTTARLELLAPVPVVSLTADPETLAEGERDFAVTARVKDARGAGLTGRPPQLQVEGATVRARLRDNGDGTYTARYRLERGREAAVVTAVPPSTPSQLHAHRLLLWTGRNAFPADGTSRIPVTVMALDAFGLPVPGIAVTLAVPQGDASVPPSATTDDQGLVRTFVTSGQTPGLVALQAEAAGLTAAAPLFQVDAAHVAPAVEPSGNLPHLEELAAWRASIPTLTVAREGAGADVGPPAVVEVSTIPPYTTPGAAILVTLRISDANGRPVTDVTPQVTSTPGTVGGITDNGDGTFNLPVQLPPGQDGPLVLTIEAGSVTRQHALPTFATAQGMAPPSAPSAPAASSVTPTSSPGSSRGTSEPARRVDAGGSGPSVFRIQGGIAAVAHVWSQSYEGGETTWPPESGFSNGNFFKGDLGGSPAVSARILVRPRALPVALDVDALAYFETIEDDNDDQHEHTGQRFRGGIRYRFPLSSAFYAYGLAGMSHANGLVFAYEDDSRTAAVTTSLPFTGARLGAGLGMEQGPWWVELVTAGTFTLAPSIFDFGLEAAWEFNPNVYTFLSLGLESRSLLLPLEDAGDEDIRVVDVQQPLVLGIGGVFR